MYTLSVLHFCYTSGFLRCSSLLCTLSLSAFPNTLSFDFVSLALEGFSFSFRRQGSSVP